MSMTPPWAWYATFTPRWHAGDSAPWLSRTGDAVGWHGARMAILARLTWADASPALIWACIAHDLGEAAAGDAPVAAKADPTLAGALDRIEGAAIAAMGMDYPLSARDRDRLKYLDRLDAYLWMQHHAPHLADRDDWRRDRAWLDAHRVTLVGVAA